MKGDGGRKDMWLINTITFICAFLLFQIELIIAKIFLPSYGGSYLVWGSCVVFFQAVLLLGYLAAHWGIQSLGMSRYRFYHLVLMFVPLLFFPGQSLHVQPPPEGLPLSLAVFVQLLVTIGPVFFVLSTASIVWQCWLTFSSLPQKDNPYALYATSNLGSFFALLSYPFLFESYLGLSRQLLIWRGLYILVAGLNILAFIRIQVKDPVPQKQEGSPADVDNQSKLVWFLFGAAGVIMFLSVNNIITTRIAPMPLLWVVSLSIYLLAFVLCFKRRPWYPEWIDRSLPFSLGMSIVFYFLVWRRTLPIAVELIISIWLLFVLCMFCQGQLARSRPAQSRHLTHFYVWISFGSFVGGIVTTWLIPVVFPTLIEFIFGLAVIAVAVYSRQGQEQKEAQGINLFDWILIVLPLVVLSLWPRYFREYHFWGIALLITVFWWLFKMLSKKPKAMMFALLGVLFLVVHLEGFWSEVDILYRDRNYYGTITVTENDIERSFIHGDTIHGTQFLDERFQSEPTAYFGRTSPIGEVLTASGFKFSRIGVMGLGIGTLAAYINGEQSLDYFEIDPDINNVAERYFTFVPRASGPVQVIFGDARLSMAKMPERYYDLIIMDAFSGDSIPVHLLTQEAVVEFRKHLKKDGLLLIHISNRNIFVDPVLAKTAEALGARACSKYGKVSATTWVSQWVAMTWDRDIYRKLTEDNQWRILDSKKFGNVKLWTDDYINILPIIKTGVFVESLRNFKPFYWPK